MAADQQSQLFSATHYPSALSCPSTLITNEVTVIVMPQAADPVAAPLHHDAGSVAAALTNNSLQSSLCWVQTGVAGTGSETSGELHPPLIACTSNGDLSSCVIHPCSHDILHPICDCCSKKTVHCEAPLQVRVTAVDNGLGSTALQNVRGRHMSPIITTQAHEVQFPCGKLHANKEEGSTKKVQEVDKKEREKARELDPAGEEEKGCVTPTARDQRIPQYDVELNAVCPPAPRKKSSWASKRRRLLDYSANEADAGAAGVDDCNYRVVAERRAFLIDPPDLHTFPDSIRALFK